MSRAAAAGQGRDPRESAVAGGSIAHLHGHIVPRWNGDNNFMPVLGQTRILPQSLDATWEKLESAARRLAPAATS